MAYKTDSLSKVLGQVDDTMIRLKQFSDSIGPQMAAAGVDADYVLNIRYRLNRDRATLQSLASVPGLVQYAKDQKNDQGYDIAAEFATVISAISAISEAVESTFPQDGSGYLLERKFSGDAISIRLFTPSQTAGLRILINSLSSTIE